VTAERFAADVGGGRKRPANRFTSLVGGGFTEPAALDAPLNPVRQQAQGRIRVVFPVSIANKVRSHLNAMGRAPVERPFAGMLMRAPLVDERSSILGIRNIIVLLGIPGQERIPLAGEVQREFICFVGTGSLDKLTCAPPEPEMLSDQLTRFPAGMGSLLESFRAGVPTVCIPLGRDQADNAAAAAERGAAIALSAGAPIARIRAAITEALASRSLRNGARHMASAIAACGGAPAAANEVEQVATQCYPPSADLITRR
jgi:hypothetical protein